MADYEFPKASKIEKAYRKAQRALLDIIPSERTYRDGEEGLLITELVSHMRTLLDEAEMTVAGELGPLISWRAPLREGDWSLTMTGVDLDNAAADFGEAKLCDDAFRGPGGDWFEGSLDRAARAYRREARWDFSPGEAGMWLLMLAPISATGGFDTGRPAIYSGHLVGFVILHDRDEDGDFESVAHIWTASAWRRRGIARQLLAEARSRFPITGVEGPCTDDGGAFLRAVGKVADGTT